MFILVFKTRVGYDVLAHAVRGLLSDVETVDEVLGSLLALALQNFSISGVIASLRSTDSSELSTTLTAFEPQFRFIHHPGAIKLLWKLVSDHFASDFSSSYRLVKLFDHIARAGHRNTAVLCDIGLVGSLFDAILDSKDDTPDGECLHRAKQELLRRLLDVGTSTAEARNIFRKVINDGGALHSGVLEILRAGMRARWPFHFSFESQAALSLAQEGLKGMPTTGFTFMVTILISFPMTYYRRMSNSHGYGLTDCPPTFHTASLASGWGQPCASPCAYDPMVESSSKPRGVAKHASSTRQ